MNGRNVLTVGLLAAIAILGVTFAFRLLNRPNDLAVGGGYLLLVAMAAGAVELARRVRK
jgi:ABC-type uncharacterized transport system permease subunit